MSRLPLAVRLAWCEVRRHRGRTALVVLVLALPLAVLAAVAIGISTVPPTHEDMVRAQFGYAEGAVHLDGWDPADVVDMLPPGTRHTFVRSVHLTVYDAGQFLHPNIQEVDLDSPVVEGMYELTGGRDPSARREVAVNASLAEDLGLAHGDTWDPPDLEICGGNGCIAGEMPQLTVVGTIRPKLRRDETLMIAAPGTLLDVTPKEPSGDLPAAEPTLEAEAGTQPGLQLVSEDLLVDLPEGIEIWELDLPLSYEFPSNNELNEGLAIAGSFGAVSLALVEVGFIAAAAVAVGTDRRRRELGLLSATGATPRQLRRVVLLTGAVLGLLGGLLGTATGIVAFFLARPHLPRFTEYTIGATELPIAALAGAVILGVVAGVGAAALPASRVRRGDPLALLRSRRPTPGRPGRLAGAGVALVAIGVPVTAVGVTQNDTSEMPALGVGLIGLGTVAVAPLLVQLLGRQAQRVGLVRRLALRDIARHSSRSGAAISAMTVLLAAPVGLATYTLSIEATETRDTERPLAEDTAFIPAATASGEATPGTAVEASLEEVPGATSGQLWAVYDIQVVSERTQPVPYEDTWTSSPLLVGDLDTLAALGAEEHADAFRDGAILTWGIEPIDGKVEMQGLEPEAASQPPEPSPAIQVSETPRTRHEAVVYVDVAEARGWELTVQGTLIRAPEALGSDDYDRIGQAVAEFGPVLVEGDHERDSAAAGRAAATAAAGGTAALIALAALALVANEGRHDDFVLHSVGATPRLRRRILAWSAAVLCGVAGLLGAVAGFVPAALIQATRDRYGLDPYVIAIPWPTIAAGTLALPVLLGLAFRIAGRRGTPALTPRH